MTEPPSSIYECGGFRIDAARRLVSREGDTIPLAAKAFDTLLYLVGHPGVVLDKEELLKTIWPHTVVEENNLNQSISALRRMFGESPGENRYIVTVPGRGYQFVAAVTKVQIPQAAAEHESPVPSRSSQPPDVARRSSRSFVVVALSAMALVVALYYLAPIRTTTVATPQLPLTGQVDLTRHGTEDSEADPDYLEGRFYSEQRTHEGLWRAVKSFGKAIERDPNNAPAHAGLANAYALLGVFHEPPKDVFPLAKKAALQALMIDDRLAEAHAALGHIKVQYEYDWAGAERDYLRAIELDSRSANAHLFYALCLTQLGRFDEGRDEIQRAQHLAPSSLFVQANAGHVLFQAGRFDAAVKQLTQLRDANPNLDLGHSLLGHAYLQQRQFERAIIELWKQRSSPGRSGDLGQAYALAGRRDKAFEELGRLRALARERRYVAPYHQALIYASLGDHANALTGLEQAYEDRSTLLVWIKVDPRLNMLRSEPRFRELLKRMHLQ